MSPSGCGFVAVRKPFDELFGAKLIGTDEQNENWLSKTNNFKNLVIN